MIKIQKDDTIVRDSLAILALLFQATVLLPAELAPIINDPVIPFADIFLKPPLIQPVHFTISIFRFSDDTFDNPLNPFEAGRVRLLYFLQFLKKMVCGSIQIFGVHGLPFWYW